MVTTEQPLISIPIEISLSEEGDNFFLKNSHRMDAFHLLKGRGNGGHRLKGFNPRLIQNLLTYSFLRKVSLVFDDLLPNRNKVVDITKLLVYGMSYRQFADDVLNLVLASEPLAAWNRRNPRQRIDSSNCRGRNFTSFIEKRKNYQGLAKFLEHTPEAERENLVSSAKRFLNGLDSFTWFFLLSYRNDKGWEDVYRGTVRLLQLHLNRVSFIEYTALVVVELLQLHSNAGSPGRG